MSNSGSSARRIAFRTASSANARTRRLLGGAAVRATRAVRAREIERPGVTVVTVTWNAAPFLQAQLREVQRRCPQVEHLVIDNNSQDDTRDLLSTYSGVRCVRLPVNLGHGAALDIAVLLAETEFVVSLDVDAFPIRDNWTSEVLGALESGAAVAGAYLHRNYIHPCFLALRRRAFVENRWSFRPIGRPSDPPGCLFMDVGESLCHMAAVRGGASALHRVNATAVKGPGMAGTVFGDCVYHNFYSTQGSPDLRSAAQRAWTEALEEYAI